MAASPPSGRPRRLLVIRNPVAGRRRIGVVDAVVDALRHEGADVSVLETKARGDAERIAGTCDATFDALVAAGGDGTVNEVTNGLLARQSGDALPCLGIIPTGTVNLLARELLIPREPAPLARLLASGPQTTIHPGEANDRRFLLMVGVGFDARVVDEVDAPLKRRLGRFAYVWQSARQLMRHDGARYRVRIDDREAVEAASVIVAKGRYYGGSFRLARDAAVSTPSFEVCLFEHAGRGSALMYMGALATGMLARAPGYRIVSAQRVHIEGPAGDPVQGDGDTLTRLPLDVRLSPRTLSVIAP